MEVSSRYVLANSLCKCDCKAMIKANELRIGNLVLVDTFIFEVHSLNKIGINLSVDDEQIIEFASYDEDTF